MPFDMHYEMCLLRNSNSMGLFCFVALVDCWMANKNAIVVIYIFDMA